MTSDLCTEDVVVQINQQQIVPVGALTYAEGGGGSGGGGSRVQATSAAVELGRRLLQAARAGDTTHVRHLMAKGAPFTTDWLGTSPLHLAAGGGHVGTCAVLLRAGVSRDARTKVDRTPLHLAAHAGHAQVASLLLQHGANVDCRDMLQMTPLHWAAERGHAACCGVLVRAGADPAARCKFRRTPQALARRRGHAHVLRALRDAEALRNEEMHKDIVTPAQPEPAPAPELKQEHQTKTEQKPKKSDSSSESSKDEGGGSGSGEGAALLRQHGITLLADEPPATVLSALRSGRTLVLSDAGKLMLKESDAPVQLPPSPAARGGRAGGGVVVRATPVRGAPRGGKTFLLSLGHANKLVPARQHKTAPATLPDTDLQVKCVPVPTETKVAGAGAGAGGAAAGSEKRAVTIVVNRAQLSRLPPAAARRPAPPGTVVPAAVAGARSTQPSRAEAPGDGGGGAGDDMAQLRAQLSGARAAVRALTQQLATCRRRLARYEPV